MSEETGQAGRTPPPSRVTLGGAMVLLGVQALIMGGLGWLLWTWSAPSRPAFVSFSISQACLGLAFALVLIASAVALFRCFPRAGERLVRLQADTYAFLGPRLGWPAILFISLCAGVGEEALFRGGLQTWLSGYVGPLPAIALSAAIFALVHLGRPVITAMLFVVGALFGVVFWLTGSLFAVMLAHVLYDIWALRYLHREFVRLGLVAATPPLANPDGEV
jgi:uncharacterized protein